MNAYITTNGDILPFAHIIRVMRVSMECARVMFVNGSVDIADKDDLEPFLMVYEEWLAQGEVIVVECAQ